MIGIGSTVWVFDPNHRVFPKDRSGGPLYREHFRPRTIRGETRTSWILDRADGHAKVDKKTWRTRKDFGGNTYAVATSQEEIDDACYVHDKRYRISEAVRRCDNAKVLRHIEGVLKGNP